MLTMLCEFAVPDDIAEPPRRLLDALSGDSRWAAPEIEFVRRRRDDDRHLIVRTTPPSGATHDLARTCEGVADVVAAAVRGASLLACSLDEG